MSFLEWKTTVLHTILQENCWKTRRLCCLPFPLPSSLSLFVVTFKCSLFELLCLLNTSVTMPARKTVRSFLPIQLSRAELAQELVHAFAGLGSVLSLPLWCRSEAKELFIGWGPDFFSPLLALPFKLHVSNIPFLFFL